MEISMSFIVLLVTLLKTTEQSVNIHAEYFKEERSPA
jgi:hypothetical protein